MKKILFTIAVWSATIYRIYAQTAPENTQVYNFTITDCINYAIQHQDTVVNAGLDVKSAAYRIKEITGSGLPQISGTASFQDYIKSPTQLFPDFITPLVYGVLVQQKVKDGNGNVIVAPTGTNYIPVSFYQKYNSNLGANLNQIIFDGSYIVGLKAAKTYKELYQRNYIRSKVDVTVNVTKAYYQVLVSREQIRLLDANIKQLKQQLDQTIQQNKQGFVEKIDVDRLKVQYNNLVTNRENTIRLLILNAQLLKFQMGMPIQTQLLLKDNLENVQLDSTQQMIAPVDTGVYHQRIEYSLLETQLKLNQLDLLRYKSQYLPTLNANASSSLLYQNNSFSHLFDVNYPTTYIGLTLNIPIFSGGQRLNRVRQANITVQKTQNDLYNLQNALSLQASQAEITYINGLKSLDNQKLNQELANEVLRVAKIKYQQGVGSSIEVTQAETALVEADNSYIQGLYSALISKVDLDRALGKIK